MNVNLIRVFEMKLNFFRSWALTFSLSLGLTVIGFCTPAWALDTTDFESLAIQDGGRIKPFDTFARESVQLITGKETHNGKTSTEMVLAWLFMPQEWANKPFIQIKHLELKRDLGFAPEQSYASPMDFVHNAKLPALMTDLSRLQKEKKKL